MAQLRVSRRPTECYNWGQTRQSRNSKECKECVVNLLEENQFSTKKDFGNKFLYISLKEFHMELLQEDANPGIC